MCLNILLKKGEEKGKKKGAKPLLVLPIVCEIFI